MATHPMRKRWKPRFVVMDPFGDPVFNTKTQDHFFPNVIACQDAVEAYTEEFVAEDLDTGEMLTRGEEISSSSYVIFKEVKS